MDEDAGSPQNEEEAREHLLWIALLYSGSSDVEWRAHHHAPKRKHLKSLAMGLLYGASVHGGWRTLQRLLGGGC